jgi:hypothetical protein
MAMIVWGWAGVWLTWCLWLDWQVNRSWLPGTQQVREYYTHWSAPPANALTSAGERFWRLRQKVTGRGFAAWVLLLVVWILV